MTIVETVRNAMRSFREKSLVTVFTPDGGKAAGRLSYDSAEDITGIVTREIRRSQSQREDYQRLMAERDRLSGRVFVLTLEQDRLEKIVRILQAERDWLEGQLETMILQAERDGLKRQHGTT